VVGFAVDAKGAADANSAFAQRMFGGAANAVDGFNRSVGDGAIFFPPLLLGDVIADTFHDFARMSGGDFEPTDALYLVPGAGKLAESTLGKSVLPVELGARVDQVHGALDPIAAGRRTTAGLDTVEGTRVLASGGRDLTPAQRALMAPGEAAAKLPGAHAEVTALQHAAQNGLTPAQMAVSRKICPACRAAIEQSGGQLTSSTTATWPR
jgi:hypothetical protein